MATFTEQELALAVRIHRAAEAINARAGEARALGLYVSLRVEEFDEASEPSESAAGGDGLKVLVFKTVIVEAADVATFPPPAPRPRRGPTRTPDAESLLRSWRACMREPRPSDWEVIVSRLLEDTDAALEALAASEHGAGPS